MVTAIKVQNAVKSKFAADLASVILFLDTTKYDTNSITFTSDAGSKFTVFGQFDYAGTPSKNNFLGGTITSAKLVDVEPDGDIVHVLGLNLDAPGLIAAFGTGDLGPVYELFGPINFTGNDQEDEIVGSQFGDTLTGGGGNDTIYGYEGGDTVDGGAGLDSILAGDGDDIVAGGKGGDVLNGGNGKDTLDYSESSGAVDVNLSLLVQLGKGGDAELDQIGQFENIRGSDFNDRLSGVFGVNVLDGGLGNDVLRGGDGADQLFGGGGNDTADYLGSASGVTVNLETGACAGGTAQGDALSEIENLNGSKNDDTFTGNNLVNILFGSAGNDRLDGGVNGDTLDGGVGGDRLIGGQGVDTAFGRAGADTFVLSNLASSADLIKDFKTGTDALEINAALFGGGLTAGVVMSLGAVEVNTTGLASTSDARFILNSTTGELFFDINGNKFGADGSRLVATLNGNVSDLSVNDFDIV